MRYLIISALAFMLSLPVAAQDFEKGLQAFDRGDYSIVSVSLSYVLISAEDSFVPPIRRLINAQIWSYLHCPQPTRWGRDL